MNNNDKQPRPRKVFDVMRPGKAPASPTSRPVIVGHKPQPPDDQFVPRSNTRLAGDPSEERPLLGHKQPDLEPNTDVVPDTTHESVEPAPVDERPAEPTDDIKPTASAEPGLPDGSLPAEEEMGAPEPEQSVLPHEDAQTSETPEELPQEPGAMPQQNSQQTTDAETFAKPMTQDEVLAETDAPMLEHAIVSHHKKHRTRLWEWVLIFLLMVIVAVVALNFLLDAEVITTNLDIPHTDLIKDN
jgi:hypothetical protein